MMFVMTSIELGTPDERFGHSVAVARGWQQMSQRELANALTERGFKVDASAVSRIESGSRAVRLAEALIVADALDVDLSFLVSGLDRSPRAELKRVRRFANEAFHSFREPLVQLLRGYIWVHGHLREHPELLGEIRLEEGETLDSVDDYFAWAAGRINALEAEAQHEGRRDIEDDYVPYMTDAARDGVHSIVNAYVDAVLMHMDEFERATAVPESGDVPS